MDDEQVESLENFTVKLLRVIGGARLGEVTSVTISIPPNDSPLGQFGFQQLEVNLKYYHNYFLLSYNNDTSEGNRDFTVSILCQKSLNHAS